MAGAPPAPHAVRTMHRSRPHPVAAPRSAAPPLIGVVTHELLADDKPGWALAPGRSERDLAPQRLSMRLSYTQAVQEAGGIAVVLPTHGYVDDTGALLDRLDGLLVSGGPDLVPPPGRRPHWRRPRGLARAPTRPSRPCGIPARASAWPCSGTPSCSRTALSI